MKWIYLGKDKFTCVDDDDYERVKDYIWSYSTVGYAHNGNLGYLHTYIIKKKTGFQIDHITSNKLDNRRKNLRHATVSQQNANKIGKSGIYFCKTSNMWRSRITLNGKNIFDKRFFNKEDADIYQKEKHIEVYGEFSRYFSHKINTPIPIEKERSDSVKHREELLYKIKSSVGTKNLQTITTLKPL
jgi:hypothetical protein